MTFDSITTSPIRSIRFHMIGADYNLSPEFAKLVEEDEQFFERIAPVLFADPVYTHP